MNEFVKHILKDAQTMPEVWKILITEGLINPQFIKDAQIYQVFTELNRTMSARKAAMETSIRLDISESTIWKSKKRIEEKFNQPEKVL